MSIVPLPESIMSSKTAYIPPSDLVSEFNQLRSTINSGSRTATLELVTRRLLADGVTSTELSKNPTAISNLNDFINQHDVFSPMYLERHCASHPPNLLEHLGLDQSPRLVTSLPSATWDMQHAIASRGAPNGDEIPSALPLMARCLRLAKATPDHIEVPGVRDELWLHISLGCKQVLHAFSSSWTFSEEVLAVFCEEDPSCREGWIQRICDEKGRNTLEGAPVTCLKSDTADGVTDKPEFLELLRGVREREWSDANPPTEKFLGFMKETAFFIYRRGLRVKDLTEENWTYIILAMERDWHLHV